MLSCSSQHLVLPPCRSYSVGGTLKTSRTSLVLAPVVAVGRKPNVLADQSAHQTSGSQSRGLFTLRENGARRSSLRGQFNLSRRLHFGSRGGDKQARAAFISPPADPQLLNTPDEEELQKVLGSVPIAPRAPKALITWSLVGGLLWKQKVRLTLAFLALAASTTCTLTMPLFSGKLCLLRNFCSY